MRFEMRSEVSRTSLSTLPMRIHEEKFQNVSLITGIRSIAARLEAVYWSCACCASAASSQSSGMRIRPCPLRSKIR